MIVRMSKVEIVGPRQRLEEVLAVLRLRGDLQVNSEAIESIGREEEKAVHPFSPDLITPFEKLLLEKLKALLKNFFWKS